MKGSKFINSWKIAGVSVKSNWKTIILTAVGLTIAFTITFQMVLFLVGSKGAMLNTFLSGEYEDGLFGGVFEGDGLNLNIGPDIEARYREFGLPSETYAQEMKEEVQQIATEARRGKLIENTRVSCLVESYLHYRTNIIAPETTRGMTLIGLSQEDIAFLQPYLFLGNIGNIQGNHTLMFYLDQYISDQIYVPANLQFNISLLDTDNKYQTTLEDFPVDLSTFPASYDTIFNRFLRQFGNSIMRSGEIIMVTTLDGLNEILTSLDSPVTEESKYYVANIDFNYGEFSIFSAQRDINSAELIRDEIFESFFYDTDKTVSYVYSTISDNLEFFYEEYTFIQITVLTLTLPPIAIAFFMINFSFNLVRKQSIHQINLLKSRGAKNGQVAFALFIEMMISSVISIVVGSGISIPLLYLIGRTSGFMKFTNELQIAEYGLNLTGKTISIFVIMGLILTVIINLPRIIRLSRLKVTNVAGEEERKKPPLWRRWKLDIVIAVLAVIDFILYLIAINSLHGDIRSTFIMIFGSSTSVFLVVAASLLIARLFVPIIKKLGNRLWKIKGGTFALSFKNLSHHNKQTSRAIILIVITLSFGLLSAVVPSTIDYNVRQRRLYTIGADVSIQSGSYFDYNQQNTIENFRYVEATTQCIINNDQFFANIGWGPTETSVVGLDPDTFLDAAFILKWKYKFSKSLPKLLDLLIAPGNVLMHENNLRDTGRKIGASFSSGFRTYTIVGTFKYFPNLVEGLDVDTSTLNEKYLVGSIATIEDFMADYASAGYNNILYVKQTKKDVGDLVKLQIDGYQPGWVSKSVDEEVEGDLEMPARIAIYAMLNSSFITTVISIVAGMSIYIMMMLFDRYRELAIIRALGCNRKEVYLSFFYEASLLLGIGIAIGLPLGVSVSTIISNITNMVYDVPPLVMDIPWLALFIIIISIVILTTIGSLIPARVATKKEINDLARTT
ncbi:MAG: FtsX-like permease family protein [Candidatus Heimdallarchaeota archaeon]